VHVEFGSGRNDAEICQSDRPPPGRTKNNDSFAMAVSGMPLCVTRDRA
jgi:hypothetical protein